MLRLNKLTDYGIVLLTYMAGAPEPLLHSARELAAGTGLPLATVGKILREMLDYNLVVSRRGTKGGYTLARPAGNISVAEIIAAMEGPIAFTECYTAPGCCDLEPSCTVRYNSGVIGRALHRALENIRLADLTRPLHLAHMAGGKNVVYISLGPGREQ